MKHLVGLAALVAFAVAQGPVIRVTTRLVEVNVIVRDKNGPVRGLTQDDFQILEKGKPRRIAFFSVNSIDTVKGPAEPLPANVFTNRPDLRRETPTTATIVLLDSVNTLIEDQLYARKRFAEFLEQARGEDRIAVYALGRGLRILSDFTTGTDRLAASVERYWGDIVFPRDEMDKEAEVERRVRITMEAFDAIANHVGRLPGRKNLMWVTSSIPFEDARRPTSAPPLSQVTRALNDAGIAVYPVDARGLVGMPRYSAAPVYGPYSFTPRGQDTMQALALDTGGRAFINNNDILGSIRKVFEDSELTYTVGFYPEPESLDSLYHDLKVRVNRKGVEVRHRRGYYASADAPVSNQDNSSKIRAAILSPLEAGSIALTVEADSTKADSVRLTITTSAGDLALVSKQERWRGEIEVVFSQRSADGRDVGTSSYARTLDFDRAAYDDALQKGVQGATTIQLAPEAVQVKVVVLDLASGKLGSLAVPLHR